MINGYVINNLGRGKHIFKQSVFPGMKVPLDKLYEQYSVSYGGEFNLDFLKWLEKTKIPKGSGFDIVVEDIKTEVEVKPVTEEVTLGVRPQKVHPTNLTAKQISDLKIKDKPKIVLQEVMSVHKLRRAYTLCKNRPGKETLSRLVRERMVELS